MYCKNNYSLLYMCSSVCLGLVISICLTYGIMKEGFRADLTTPSPVSAEDIQNTLFDNIDAKKIKFLLKSFSEDLTSDDEGIDANTLFVYNNWSQMGLNTSFARYSVLASEQNKEQPNSVTKFNRNGQVLHKSVTYYLAYSPPTESPLNGTPIYVNFGGLGDYSDLSDMNVSVRGHFVMARHSDIPPGDVLRLAEDKGALALILFYDSYSKELEENSTNLQAHVLSTSGDPQTPFYASTERAQRLPISESKLPRIPAISVSYVDAIHILKGLKGLETPSKWKLNSDNTHIGPDYEDQSYLTLAVNTILKEKTIQNVIGVIEGCTEPDRYVIVGSGGTAFTGTAALMALSESFAKTMKTKKWCPRRSIVFCSWAPQLYPFIGSTEWLEEHQFLLKNQAIAYLNVDLDIRGNFTFMANSVPILLKTTEMAIKFVKNPNQQEVTIDGLKTVYDSYLEHETSQIGLNPVKSPFLQITGVPVLEYYYDCDKSTENHCNPSPDLLDNPMDINLNFSVALISIYAETLRLLSDRPLLPFTESLENTHYQLEKNLIKIANLQISSSHNFSLDFLKLAIIKFHEAVLYFEKAIQQINEQDDLVLRKVNDILIRLERSFIDDRGLPYNKDQRHVLYGPDRYNSNDGHYFPGIYRLLWTYIQESDQSVQNKVAQDLKEHISVIICRLNSATNLLKQTFDQNFVPVNLFGYLKQFF